MRRLVQILGVLAHADRLASDIACRALAARSVAVEGLALRACTLCFPFSVLCGGIRRHFRSPRF